MLGHSERRTLNGETSDFVADKTAYALSKGLSVILCIGETLAEREAGTTNDVVAAQLVSVCVRDWFAGRAARAPDGLSLTFFFCPPFPHPVS